jgi:hypothetical protein
MSVDDARAGPREGMAVVGSDGAPLGTVAELIPQAFRVDVPLKPDFWLLVADVHSASDGRVVMRFSRDDLGDHTHRRYEFEGDAPA